MNTFSKARDMYVVHARPLMKIPAQINLQQQCARMRAACRQVVTLICRRHLQIEWTVPPVVSIALRELQTHILNVYAETEQRIFIIDVP